MDDTVDPCDNFYEFACGNYIRNTPSPQLSYFENAKERSARLVKIQLKVLLEEPLNQSDSKTAEIAKRIYRTCCNYTTHEKSEFLSILDILRFLGGWPVISKTWDEGSFDWKKTLHQVAKLGFKANMIFTLSIYDDPKNSSIKRIAIGEPFTGEEPKYFWNLTETGKKKHCGYISSAAIQFGAARDVAIADAKEIFTIQDSLANLSVLEQQQKVLNSTPVPITLRQLQAVDHFIDWKEYINSQLPENVQLDDDDEVVILSHWYVDGVPAVLRNTNNRALANYILWRVVLDSIKDTGIVIFPHSRNFFTNTSDDIPIVDRSSICIDLLKSKIPVALSAMYARKNFDPSSKKIAENITDQVQKQFEQVISKSDWMSSAVKEIAKEKVKSIFKVVGYPKELLNNTLLDEHYKEVKADKISLLKTLLSINLAERNFYFQALKKPITRKDWEFTSNIVLTHASYEDAMNLLIIPAGLMQGSIFRKGALNAINYGTIGFIIGHEIMHGFDLNGMQYDKSANKIKWDAGTMKAYKNITNCLIKQYQQYFAVEKGVHVEVDAIQSLNEILADNGGLQGAYCAYDQAKNSEERLPGLDLKSEQLFWLALANMYCSVYSEEYLKDIAQAGYHPLEMFRVIGPFSNSPEFARDFNCRAGSPMNPVEKCTVW